MQTSKVLCKHIISSEIYAIEMAWDGSVLWCRGPLPSAGFISLDWVREENDKMLFTADIFGMDVEGNEIRAIE